jgi:four helix bundle protein
MKDGPLYAYTNEASDLTIRFVQALPDTDVHRPLGLQLLDSGTSQAANYSAARRARSPADFVAKMKIVEEEADESLYWLGKLQVAGLPHALHKDAERLIELFAQIVPLAVSSIKTTRARHLPNRRRRPRR